VERRSRLSSVDYLLFPIELPDGHWGLVVAVWRERRIVYVDSNYAANSVATSSSSKHRSTDHGVYSCMPLANVYRFLLVLSDIIDDIEDNCRHGTWTAALQITCLQQMNAYDSGVLMCMFSLMLVHGLPTDFKTLSTVLSNDDVSFFRYKIAHCLLVGRVA
jgi:Ulp1 family protease